MWTRLTVTTLLQKYLIYRWILTGAVSVLYCSKVVAKLLLANFIFTGSQNTNSKYYVIKSFKWQHHTWDNWKVASKVNRIPQSGIKGSYAVTELVFPQISFPLVSEHLVIGLVIITQTRLVPDRPMDEHILKSYSWTLLHTHMNYFK